MQVTDISQFVRSAFTENTMTKAFGAGNVTATDYFSPPSGSMWGSQADDIQSVRGWNATAINVKALQFVQADVTVYCSKEVAAIYRDAYGDEEDEHVTSAAGGEHANVPKNYVVAPTSHRIAKLLDNPNPFTSASWFKYEMSQQVDAHGVCVIVALPDENGKPFQLYVIPRALCYPVPPCAEAPSGGWRTLQLCRWFGSMFKQDGNPRTRAEMYGAYLSNRIFDAKYVMTVGQPSLLYADEYSNQTHAMRDVIDADQQLNEARRKTFENGPSGGARFTVEKGVTLTRDEQEQIVAEYQAKMAGASNAGAAGFTPPGVGISEPHTAKDMDYVEGSKEMRDSQLAQRGVPPAMVGLGDFSSYASVEATIAGQAIIIGQPLMRLIAEQLEVGLKSFFGAPYNEFCIRIQANSIVDPERRLKEVEIQLGAQTLEKDEIREYFGRKKWGGTRGKEIAGQPSAPEGGQPGAAEDPLAKLMAGAAENNAKPETPQQSEAQPQTPDAEKQFGAADTLKCPPGNQIRPLDPPCECNCEKETPGNAMLSKAFGPTGQQQDLLYFRIPRALSRTIREWQEIVSNSFPVTKLVDDLHCSVLYPVLSVDENAGQIAEVVEDHEPFEVQFGNLIVFRNGDADVVVMEIVGRDLKDAKRSLQNRIDCGISGHLEYRPHVTLAYCKPGSVPKSIDNRFIDGLTGEIFDVRELVLTDDGLQHVLSLGAKPEVGFRTTSAGRGFSTMLKAVEAQGAPTENERASLIADVLYSLYGDAAARIFDNDQSEDDHDPMLSKDWDESRVRRHAKGKGRESGRFAPKNTAENVVAVHDSIKRALKGQRSAESAKELMDLLGTLTVQQLRELKLQYQMSASGRTKGDLVEKIARRLDTGRREPEAVPQGVGLDELESSNMHYMSDVIERADQTHTKNALKKLANGEPLSDSEHKIAVRHLQHVYNTANSAYGAGDPDAVKRGQISGSVLQKLGVDPQERWKKDVGSKDAYPRQAVNLERVKAKYAAGDVHPGDYTDDQIEYRKRLERAEKAVAENRLSREQFETMVERDTPRAAPKDWDKPKARVPSGREVGLVSTDKVINLDASDEFTDIKPENVAWWKGEIDRVGIENIEPPTIGLTADGKQTVINGRHRLLAAQELGYHTVPAFIPEPKPMPKEEPAKPLDRGEGRPVVDRLARAKAEREAAQREAEAWEGEEYIKPPVQLSGSRQDFERRQAEYRDAVAAQKKRVEERKRNLESQKPNIPADAPTVAPAERTQGRQTALTTQDDEPFKLLPPKRERKAQDFGVNENSRQGALFDTGKPKELPGQNLLFNSDAGDLENPRTMENRMSTTIDHPDKRRAEILRRSPVALREAITERAQSIGVHPVDLHQAVEDAWKIEKDNHAQRERMKRTAREYTGVSLQDIKEIENNNLDHDTVLRFDDTVQAMRDEYPELATMRDPNDFVWNLIREGAQPVKPKHHPDVLDAAEQMIGRPSQDYGVAPSGGAEVSEADDWVPEEHRGWLERSFNPDRTGKRRRFWVI